MHRAQIGDEFRLHFADTTRVGSNFFYIDLDGFLAHFLTFL